MVIRYEYRCPECGYEFFADNIYPECPRCGYIDKEGEKDASEEMPKE